MNQSINTTAIITASITGIIALVGIIIQIITFNIKHKYDTKNNFEQVLKEKLEKIYSPLVIYITDQESEFLAQYEIKTLISKFGHLLSKELLDDIREVFRLQKTEGIKKERIYSSSEYSNLKIKIIDRINKDFYELQDTYNINYTNNKKSLYTPSYEKIIQIIIKGCTFVTISFYVVWILLSILVRIAPGESIFNNIYADIIATVFMLIVILTSMIGIPALFIYLSEKWTQISRKIRKHYATNEYVPETNMYVCRICNNRVKLTKYSKFPMCNHHNIIQFIKYVFMFYTWKQCEVKDIRINKRTNQHIDF